MTIKCSLLPSGGSSGQEWDASVFFFFFLNKVSFGVLEFNNDRDAPFLFQIV